MHVSSPAGTRGWARRSGGRLFGDETNDQFLRYEQSVRRFVDSDLSDPAVQLALAEAQISGAMEWAYARPAGDELPGLESTDECLGKLARKLRDLASRVQKDKEQIAGRTPVQFSDREDLFAKAREIYSQVTGAEVQGAGGVSFLLSCSLERSASDLDGEIVLLSADLLGARAAPHGREGDLLEQLGSNGLEIIDVTGNSLP
jgi:hypothetical protein